MKTAIMTDTNSAITVEEGKKLGIFVLPMPVLIDDQEYEEGKDISYDQIWEAFDKGSDVHTSMPSIGDLTDMWDEILDQEGYDELLYLPMTSGLSGSCGAAEAAAAADYEGRVYVADNHRISYTLMNSVFDALEMAKKGMSALQIKAELEKNAFESSIYIAVNTVSHLVKSGRVTRSAAGIADVLHLKPVLQIQGDKLDSFAKGRGMHNAEEKMIAAIRKDISTRFAGVPKEHLSIGTAGTLRTKEEQERWRKRIEEAFPGFRVMYRPLSCSIACHIGSDTRGTAVTVIDYDQAKYAL